MHFLKNIYMKIRGIKSTKELIDIGLTVGENFKRAEKVLIDNSHCWLITIGDDVTLAPKVHILAHDASTKTALGYTRLGTVNIGNNVFVGASSTILPGVDIGDNVVIGAGSIVSKDVPENSVVAGNPARFICSYNEYIDRKKSEMEICPVFDESYTLRNPQLNDEMKKEMKEKLEKIKFGYIV